MIWARAVTCKRDVHLPPSMKTHAGNKYILCKIIGRYTNNLPYKRACNHVKHSLTFSMRCVRQLCAWTIALNTFWFVMGTFYFLENFMPAILIIVASQNYFLDRRWAQLLTILCT